MSSAGSSYHSADAPSRRSSIDQFASTQNDPDPEPRASDPASEQHGSNASPSQSVSDDSGARAPTESSKDTATGVTSSDTNDRGPIRDQAFLGTMMQFVKSRGLDLADPAEHRQISQDDLKTMEENSDRLNADLEKIAQSIRDGGGRG